MIWIWLPCHIISVGCDKYNDHFIRRSNCINYQLCIYIIGVSVSKPLINVVNVRHCLYVCMYVRMYV